MRHRFPSGNPLFLLAVAATIASMIASQPALAQSATARPAASSWILGMARFDEEEGSGGNSPVFYAALIPRLLIERLPVLPDRAPSWTNSPGFTASTATSATRYAAGKALAVALDDKARIELDPDMDSARRSAELRTAQARIENSRAKIRELDGESIVAKLFRGIGLSAPAATSVQTDSGRPAGATDLPGDARTTATTVATAPKPSPGTVWWKGAASGTLPVLDPEGPAKTAAVEGLDGLIFGSVRRDEGELTVVVKAYEKTSGRIASLYSGKTSLRSPQDICPAIAAAIEDWVADRAMARLDLRVEPADASLSINGVEAAGSKRRYFYFSRETISIVAKAEGFRTYRRMLDIVPGADQVLAIDLEPLSAGIAAAKSQAGLDPGLMKILDEGAAKSYAPGFDSKKDAFYAALGFFVGSLPCAILAGGNFSLYAEAATRTEDSRIATGYTVSAAILGAGIAATTFFAVKAIIRLVDYLGAAH